MKKSISVLLLLCLCVSLLGGCGSGDAYTPTGDGLTWDEDYTGPVNTAPNQGGAQELTLIWYPDRTVNPYSCTDFTNRVLLSLLYQGLFAVDRDYAVEPVLCKSYRVSEDMKVYTFYPAQATFSDGSPLTAQDIADSLLAAKNSTVYGGRFSHVEQIAVEGEGITVTLDTAYENLPLLLDIPIVKSGQTGESAPLGTGPYRLEGEGSAPMLRRRTDWWCAATMTVTAPAISLVTATSATQIRDTFEFEDLDLVCADPGSDRYADYRCDYELWDSENGIFLYLACNMISPVFSLPEIRAALPMAVDRNAIVEQEYRGFARAASLPASPLSPYYNNTLAARYAYDGGEALTQAWAAAKNQLPAETVVQLLVNSDDSLRARVARTVAENLRACGLPVVLVEKDSQGYLDALRHRNYDLCLGQTKLSPNMDLSAFFSSDGALSFGSLDSVSLYTLCTEALANHGNFYSLHQAVMDDGRLCPILFRSYAVYAERGLLTSLTPARDSIFYYSLGRSLSNALEQ